MKKRHEQKLVILSVMLLAAFSMPLLLLFDSAKPFYGLPAIYVYLFLVWLLSIIVSFYIIKKYNE